MDIERRFERLERQNRRLRAGLLTTVLSATAVLLVGARGDVAEVVRARQVEVVGAGGESLAVLGQQEGQGYLALLDAAGNWKVQLHALAPGGSIALKNTAGQPLVRLGYDGEGNGTVRTAAKDGSSLVALSSSEGGRGAVTTYDVGGQELVALSTTQGGAGAVTTFSTTGQRMIGITATTNGQGIIAAFDSQGGVRSSWP